MTLRRPTRPPSRRLDTRALMHRTANVADRRGLPLEVGRQLRCIAPFQAFLDEPSEHDPEADRQSQPGRRASCEHARPIEHVRWQYEEDLRLVHAHHPPCAPGRGRRRTTIPVRRCGGGTPDTYARDAPRTRKEDSTEDMGSY